MNIDAWLRRIGLEQYAQTLRDHAIDADVLRDLTDEHLRELGLPLGARLKLLRAVREIISAYQKCVAETVQRFDGSRRSLKTNAAFAQAKHQIIAIVVEIRVAIYFKILKQRPVRKLPGPRCSLSWRRQCRQADTIALEIQLGLGPVP